MEIWRCFFDFTMNVTMSSKSRNLKQINSITKAILDQHDSQILEDINIVFHFTNEIQNKQMKLCHRNTDLLPVWHIHCSYSKLFSLCSFFVHAI